MVGLASGKEIFDVGAGGRCFDEDDHDEQPRREGVHQLCSKQPCNGAEDSGVLDKTLASHPPDAPRYFDSRIDHAKLANTSSKSMTTSAPAIRQRRVPRTTRLLPFALQTSTDASRQSTSHTC